MKKRIVFGIVGAYLFLAVIMGSLHQRSQRIPWYEKYPVQSDYLLCYLPLLYLTGACPSCDPSCVRTPQSSAVSVIL